MSRVHRSSPSPAITTLTPACRPHRCSCTSRFRATPWLPATRSSTRSASRASRAATTDRRAHHPASNPTDRASTTGGPHQDRVAGRANSGARACPLQAPSARRQFRTSVTRSSWNPAYATTNTAGSVPSRMCWSRATQACIGP